MRSTAESRAVLQLPADPDTYSADLFQRELNSTLAMRPKSIALDCSPLERVVSAHITLLWHARLACQDRGISLQLNDPTCALIRLLHLLDLADQFVLPEAAFWDGTADQAPSLRGLPASYTEQFHANDRDIQMAIAHLLEFLTRFGVGPTTQAELRTLFYEVATNIRLHAGLDEAQAIRLKVAADQEGIALEFRDRGCPFDPTRDSAVIDPNEASRTQRRHGFGLPMIRKLSDRVVYDRPNGNENVLNILRKWCR